VETVLLEVTASVCKTCLPHHTYFCCCVNRR